MIAVGLTGGIGSGKSTVAALLERRGAELVDADVVARAVVEPGEPAYDALVERFGPDVLAPDGTVDRSALAARAFGDPVALADLNAITHPAIGRAMRARVQALERSGADVVVVVIPLLRREHVESLGLAAVVVVDCPVEVAIARVVAARGMAEDDARARVAAQESRRDRLALADRVVDNAGPPEELAVRVDELWRWVEGLGRAGR